MVTTPAFILEVQYSNTALSEILDVFHSIFRQRLKQFLKIRPHAVNCVVFRMHC